MDIRLRAIFPLNESKECDFENIDCTVVGEECNVIDDSELTEDVIEILGDESHIVFSADCNYKYLVLHLKNLSRYLTIDLQIRDTLGMHRKITLCNKRSIASIDKSVADLPLEIGEGWQHLCVDLDDLLFRCFGSNLRLCSTVTVHGSTRISKMFFQEKCYADIQLPVFLRVNPVNI